MDVLCRAVGVVAGHHGLDIVFPLRAGRDLGAVPVAARVIAAGMVCVPDVNLYAFHQLALGVHHASNNSKRKAGIARRAQDVIVRSAFAEEWAQHLRRRGLVSLFFRLLPKREQLPLRHHGRARDKGSAGDTKLQHLAAIRFGFGHRSSISHTLSRGKTGRVPSEATLSEQSPDRHLPRRDFLPAS